MTFELDKVPIDKIFQGAGISEKQMARYLKGSLKQTAKWTRTQTIRDIAQTTKVPQKVIRKKIFVGYKQSGFRARINYYVKPINLIRLGAKQNKRGVRARGIFRQSAFITELGPRKTELVMRRRGKKRLPIDPVLIPLRSESEFAIKRVSEREVRRVFYKKLSERIRWKASK